MIILAEEMSTKEEEYRAILSRYMPLSAVGVVYAYISRRGVRFRISASRSSKLGDYRMPSVGHPYHEISVNGDLTPHMFLMVLLHEMAHLETFEKYGRRVQPHGHEWQMQYANLLAEYLEGGHFPVEVRELMARYISHIPLNRAMGQRIERMLKELDGGGGKETTILGDLPIGSTFRLVNRPTAIFRSVEKRRTRYKCVEVSTGLPYLVSGNAEVEEI